jgi:hypothetical protein
MDRATARCSNPFAARAPHADPVACVEDISPLSQPGLSRAIPRQIVEDMYYWMEYEICKIAGENPSYPDHAIKSWPAHPQAASEDQWQATVGRFSDLLSSLAVFGL